MRRRVHGWVVFSRSEERPRTTKDAYYRLNGNPVYRADGHPDGPSSVPWLVIRGNRVYPGEGYPGGPLEARSTSSSQFGNEGAALPSVP